MFIGVAVEDGLVVPVLKFDAMSLSQRSVRDLAGRANKKLLPTEMEGSTFTVSNLGMFGIEFNSIINQPIRYPISRSHCGKPVVKRTNCCRKH
jgi:pyruvate dehydrogenase E2 component (dihydrolipoamide acetyltransferase)